MKMKFTAAIALAIWLAVTGWLATMVIAKPAILHLGNDADETSAMAELRAAIARNTQARERTATLRRSVHAGDGRALLALPSSSAPAAPLASASARAWTGSTTQGAPTGEAAPLQVSMVLDANGRRTAIVDGQRVRAGSRLADGSRVRAIGADRVRIMRPDGEIVDRQVQSPFLQQATGGRQ